MKIKKKKFFLIDEKSNVTETVTAIGISIYIYAYMIVAFYLFDTKKKD